MVRGELDRADDLLAEAEALLRTEGDRFILAGNSNSQALSARLRGDAERAEVLLHESIGLTTTPRDAWTVVLNASGLAGTAASRTTEARGAPLWDGGSLAREDKC